MKKFLNMDSNIFFNKYWEKQHFIIKRKDRNYYSNLFGISDLDALVSQIKPPYSDSSIRIVKQEGNQVLHKQISHSMRSNAAIFFLYKVINEGYTIILNDLDSRWKSVSILCRNLEELFHHRVGANAYFTPPHSQGFSPHSDGHDVFILQLEGSKTWKLYDPIIALPLEETAQEISREEIGNPIDEVFLDEGDLLYIPKGCIHEALTSEVSSLHLTVGIHVYRWIDFMKEAINMVAERNLVFRKAIPPSILSSHNKGNFLKNQWNELLKIMADDGQSEEAIMRITKHFFDTGSPPLDGHFSNMDKIKNITLNSVINRRSSMKCMVSIENGLASIRFSGNSVNGPLTIEPALRFIMESKKFRVKDLPDYLTDNAKLVLIKRLIKEGLLSI